MVNVVCNHHHLVLKGNGAIPRIQNTQMLVSSRYFFIVSVVEWD